MKFFSYGSSCEEKTRLKDWFMKPGPAIKRKIIMRINLIAFLVSITIMNVSASVMAQDININVQQAPLKEVLNQIKRQSGYQFLYNKTQIESAKAITINVKGAELKQVLDLCFEQQPLTYEIVNKTIVIKLKPRSLGDRITSFLKTLKITGTVTDEKGNPIPGVTIRLKGTNTTVITDTKGSYSIEVPESNPVLLFTYVGYEPVEITIKDNTAALNVTLKESIGQLAELDIVSTGYQDIPKERATGSFVQINNELLNRRVSTNILDRLDGITSGLIFNKISGGSGLAPLNEKLGISIRGRITLDDKVSADPLVVLDNFPYEGDIANINPNDIESVTVLKDAAAASIWGARSGNGVIVLTTKKGKFNQPLKIDFNSNLTIGSKPNLKYSRNFLNATDYIDIEKVLFDQHYYDNDLINNTTYPVISPAVEIFAAQRAGSLDAVTATDQLNALRRIDTRDESRKYFYQDAVSQQYALSFRGGAEKSSYSMSIGYDQNKSNNIGTGYSRLSANLTNTYAPIKNLELVGSVIYTQSNRDTGYGFSALEPYTTLADENGNALAVPYGYRSGYITSTESLGFLDWRYRPLQELDINDNTTKLKNIILRGIARYKFTGFLNAEVQYQYENENGLQRLYRSPESYDVRNNINRYTQRSASGILTYPFPLGGTLYQENQSLISNNFRTQLNYQQTLHQKHSISAIAGTEIREVLRAGNSATLWGYDDETGTAVTNLNYNTVYIANPSGLGLQLLPPRIDNISGTTNRFISYYANASYSFLSRYTLSVSGRKDGANIFGVKTNDKITPLWSAGLAYDISKEPFYNFDLIPYLKVRTTYGYNGNVYNGSAYLTASYSTSATTGATLATINGAPNPELRWEKIRNKNLAVDFATKQNRIAGTFEVYDKLGSDLIANAILEPSTGFTSFKGNTATVKTRGIDLTLNSINTNGSLKWTTILLYSYNKDKVISYDTKYTTSYLVNSTDPSRAGLYIAEGKSMFGVYAYKSAGLDPANGDPQGYLDGNVSKDYTAIVASNKTDNILYFGSSRPTSFGSIRNTFSLSGFSISANMAYKFNYFLRKNTIDLNYTELFGSLNSDYYLRWQQLGDEHKTNVPSLTYLPNANRNTFYRNSEALIIKGDHIRLQDISVSYDFDKNRYKFLPFSKLQVYGYINNLGILWRANKEGIDPDVNDFNFARYNSYPNPRTYALGIKANF